MVLSLLGRWWYGPLPSPRAFVELDRYEYQPLPNASSVRVIELLPKSETTEDHIRCKLHVIDLAQDFPAYTAISYAWGDNPISDRVPIECDGKKIEITPTLYSALQRVRPTKRTAFVWADALCINQSEDPEAPLERNAQVAMMGSIYSKAEEVLIDLGSIGQEKTIVDNLRRYMQYDEASWEVAAEVSNTMVFRSDWDRHSGDRTTVYQAFDLPTRRDKFWPLLSAFMARPWFRRLWIIQEFALARTLRAMVGDYVVDEDTLIKGTSRAAEHLNYMVSLHTDQLSNVLQALWAWVPLSAAQRNMAIHMQRLQLMQLHVETLGTLESVRICKQSKITFEPGSEAEVNDVVKFHRLFFNTRFFLASDLRDRVYGLLGLVSDHSTSTLYVDYGASLVDLSTRVSLHLIQHGFAVSALAHAVGDGSADVPSWSVAFEDTFEDVIWRGLINAEGKCVSNVFNAGGGTTPHIHHLESTQTLSIRAILIGSILTQSDAFVSVTGLLEKQLSLRTLYDFSSNITTRIRNIIVWIEDAKEQWTALKDTSDVGAEPFGIACWRTMMSDIPRPDPNGYRRLDELPNRDEILLELSGYAAVTLDAGMQVALQLMTAFPKMSFLFHRRIALTDTGPCHVPKDAQERDQIGIVLGCPIPMLFRKCGDGTYRLVGSCYVHGMMDGQALDRPELPAQDIVLS